MFDAYDLAAKLSVDTAKADRALADHQRKVQALTKEYEKLDKASSGAGSDSLAKLKQEGADFFAKFRTDVAKTQSGLDNLTGGLKGFGTSLLTAGFTTAGFTAALGINVAAVIKLHKELLDLALVTAKVGAEQVNLSRKYGVSVEAIGAAQLIAAKSGESLTKVLDGNRISLQQLGEEAARTGKVMDTETAMAAKKLNDKVIDLQASFSNLQNELGRTLFPIVTDQIDDLTKSLIVNQGAVNALIGSVGLLAAYFGSTLTAAISAATGALFTFAASSRALGFIGEITGGLSRGGGTIPVQGITPESEKVGGSVGSSIDIAFMMRPKPKRARRGGGGRAKSPPSPVGAIGSVMNAAAIDFERQYLALQKQIEEQLERSRIAFNNVTEDGLLPHLTVVGDLTDEYRPFLEVLEEYRKEQERLRQEIGVDFLAQAPLPVDTGAAKLLEEQMEAIRDKAANLASDLTSVLSDALHAGFEGGIMEGLRAFEIGILRMIESAALNALQKRLTDVFAGIFSGGGGGGSWLSRIIGFAGGTLGGQLGGGSGGSVGSFAGSRLSMYGTGGYMRSGEWGIVGERGPELVRAGAGGATVSTGGGNVINFYVQSPGQLGSRETQAQVARMITKLQQKKVLTG